MVSVHRNFLAASIISLLASHVLARSVADETLAKELGEPELLGGGGGADAEADLPYENVDMRLSLLDLLDYLMTYRHMMPDDQSDAYRMGGMKRSWRPSGERMMVPTSMKRKMFWSPLGHLPASARLGGRPQSMGTKANNVGSPVFRYG